MGILTAMAGAGQPWYMPAAWPVGHVAATISKSADDKPQENKGGYETTNIKTRNFSGKVSFNPA